MRVISLSSVFYMVILTSFSQGNRTVCVDLPRLVLYAFYMASLYKGYYAPGTVVYSQQVIINLYITYYINYIDGYMCLTVPTAVKI